jgi:hypothetical protein
MADSQQMADCSKPLIHNITVEGGWDGVQDHAINFDITIDVSISKGRNPPSQELTTFTGNRPPQYSTASITLR